MNQHYRAKYGYGDEDFLVNFIDKKGLFEEIFRLTKSNSVLEWRMAYIMTDHLIEVILNDGLERIIAEYYGNMLSPHLDGSKFNKLRMNFDAKLEFFANEMPNKVKTGISLGAHYRLSEDEAKILGVLHRYRNDMYHRDQKNDTVLKLLTTTYTSYTLQVFIQFSVRMGIGVTDGKKKRQLSGLIDNGFLYPHKASTRLKKRLLPRLQSIKIINAKLAKSLEDRYEEITITLERDLPSSKDPKVQEVLANQIIIVNDLEFSLEQSKDYKELLEAQKAAFAIKNYEKSAKLIPLMQKFQMEALENFESELSYKDFLEIKEQIQRMRSQKKLVDILEQYYEIDQKILIYRDRIIQGAIDFDREVQRQIDISRGK